MKVRRDGREGVAAPPHVHNVERDLLVDWGRDEVAHTGIKGKSRQEAVPLRSCPPLPSGSEHRFLSRSRRGARDRIILLTL